LQKGGSDQTFEELAVQHASLLLLPGYANLHLKKQGVGWRDGTEKFSKK
jgi:hypothetical protein